MSDDRAQAAQDFHFGNAVPPVQAGDKSRHDIDGIVQGIVEGIHNSRGYFPPGHIRRGGLADHRVFQIVPVFFDGQVIAQQGAALIRRFQLQAGEIDISVLRPEDVQGHVVQLFQRVCPGFLADLLRHRVSRSGG